MKKQFDIEAIRKSAVAHLNPHLFECTPKIKRAKYGNIKIELDGYTFDSKKEARRYVELRMLIASGEITDLQLQVVFQLSVCKYVCDFTYITREGEYIVEDVKSKATRKNRVYRLKNKLMLAELNIQIKEI